MVLQKSRRKFSVSQSENQSWFQIKKKLFCGYSNIDIGEGQWAYMAGPEKALLDMLYLHPHSDNWGYWRNLNLTNLDLLNEDRLRELALESESEKLRRAASKVFLAIRAAKQRKAFNLKCRCRFLS